MTRKVKFIFFSIIFLISACTDEEITLNTSNNRKNELENRNLDTNISRSIGTTTFNEVKNLNKEDIKKIAFSDLKLDLPLKYDVKAYRITYNTTDYDGNSVIASGSILIPQSSNLTDSFPILSHQHPTLFSDQDVYNNSLSTIPFVAASSGFITLCPDYLGYNSSGHLQHPYFNNRISDKNIRDMITSSLTVINSLGISHNQEISLYGFSEGANVTISLLKNLEDNPISNLKIKRVAACAGAYDLYEAIGKALQNSNNASDAIIASFFITGFEKNIAKTGALNLVFNDFYFTLISNGLLSGSYSRDIISFWYDYGFAIIKQSVFKVSFLESVAKGMLPDFVNYINENTITKLKWCPKSKVKLFHGTADAISNTHSQKLIAVFQKYNTSDSTNFELEELTGVNHDGHILFSKAIIWLNQKE